MLLGTPYSFLECIIKILTLTLLILISNSVLSKTQRLTKKIIQTQKIRQEAEEARAKLELEQAAVTPDESIAATNKYIANQWDYLNRSVDTFFTNKTSPLKNRSSIFLSLTATKTESQKPARDVDFKLRFDLPNTTSNLKIIIEKQQDDIGNALSDNSVSSSKSIQKNGRPISQKDSQYTAGANILLKNKNLFMSQLKFGIKIDMPINPSLKLDLNKEYKLNALNVFLLQKFLFYRQEGFQEISQISFQRKINEKFQIDQVNSLVWADENDDFLLRNSVILTQNLAKEKSLTYSIGANARLSPTYYYESYDTSISYSQRLYQDWLFSSFTVGANFPKGENFNDIKFVQMKLDIFFNEKN